MAKARKTPVKAKAKAKKKPPAVPKVPGEGEASTALDVNSWSLDNPHLRRNAMVLIQMLSLDLVTPEEIKAILRKIYVLMASRDVTPREYASLYKVLIAQADLQVKMQREPLLHQHQHVHLHAQAELNPHRNASDEELHQMMAQRVEQQEAEKSQSTTRAHGG